MTSRERLAAPTILVYWLALLSGLALFAWLRADDPWLTTPLWIGVIGGTVLGQILALRDFRFSVIAALIAVLYVLCSRFGARPDERLFWMAFGPAALCGALSLSDRGALVAFWLPTVLWMLSILDRVAGSTVIRGSGAVMLGLIALAFVIFLYAREARRSAMWRTISPLKIVTAKPVAVLRERPAARLGRVTWAMLIGWLTFASTAWLAPRLWQVESSDRVVISEGPEPSQPGCGQAWDELDVDRSRVKEYFDLGRGRDAERARRHRELTAECRKRRGVDFVADRWVATDRYGYPVGGYGTGYGDYPAGGVYGPGGDGYVSRGYHRDGNVDGYGYGAYGASPGYTRPYLPDHATDPSYVPDPSEPNPAEPNPSNASDPWNTPSYEPTPSYTPDSSHRPAPTPNARSSYKPPKPSKPSKPTNPPPQPPQPPPQAAPPQPPPPAPQATPPPPPPAPSEPPPPPPTPIADPPPPPPTPAPAATTTTDVPPAPAPIAHARPVTPDRGAPLVEWLLIALGITLAIQLVVLGIRPLRRAVTIRHLRRPLWTETVDQRISNWWQLVLVGLRDAGWRTSSDEPPREFAQRTGVEGVEHCATILERARHGIGLDADDLDEMGRSAEAAYRASRRTASPAARAIAWFRRPLA